MRFTTELLAVALAIADLSAAQNTTYNATAAAEAALQVELANLEKFWSYGRSPPVYPTPQGQGREEWQTAYQKAKDLVSQMTDYEKNNITYGYTSTTNGCGGNSGSVPRLGFPGMCLSDAGNGLRGTDGVNGYASGVHVGSTWNRNLAYERGHYMGAEFKAKGVNVLLGPVVGPIGRVAEGGRNWEGFSNDPYLAGSLTFDTIRGMQNSVVSCVKHLIGNEQELNRNPVAGLNASVSSNIDDKTMHETYLWPFQDAVHAGVGSVMCSYQRVNNSYGCQNSKVMNGLLKGELGFEGFVVSDWGAQHSGVASADAGLDMAMPASTFWMNGNLSQAVTNGSLTSTRLDDMATRIVAAWYHLAEFQNPGHGMPINLTLPHEFINARDPASKSNIFQTAVEGHVLVKNVKNALPLKKPGLLSLFGYDGIASHTYTPDNSLFPLSNFGFSPVSGISGNTLYALFVSPSSVKNVTLPGIAEDGTLVTGGGSGAAQSAFISDPFSAITEQAQKDDTWLQWDFRSQDPIVQRGSDACLVFINSFASESFDRPSLEDEYSDDLILNVASQCNNTIVVVHNAGIRTVDTWIENPNVTAVVYGHLPGQDSGKALVEVLYGKQSPSGRLPYTVAKKPADYGNLLSHVVPDNTSNYYTQDNFTEGVYIDYKAFIAQNITPRFEFGYGLTYTTFNYSSLQSRVLTNVSTAEFPPGNGTVAQGGVSSLWDVIATVDCTVTNSGLVTASEVAQLYVNIPGGPAKVLRGFNKQGVEPGKSVKFHFDLTRRDLSEWDVVSQQWRLQSGNYPIYVGKSVLDIQLTGNLHI